MPPGQQLQSAIAYSDKLDKEVTAKEEAVPATAPSSGKINGMNEEVTESSNLPFVKLILPKTALDASESQVDSIFETAFWQ